MSDNPPSQHPPETSPARVEDIAAAATLTPQSTVPTDYAELKNEYLRVLQINEEVGERFVRLKQEHDELKNSPDVMKAGMMAPYGNKVFFYLCGYSVGALILLLLDGWNLLGFDLPDVIIGTIVGSTALAAIALVRYVVVGIFGLKLGNDE